MNILVTICARGGSKGIPGKNIRDLNGIPLIAYSIKAANDFKKHFESNYNIVIDLSTDSDEIKKVASQFGINTEYTRPDELANDSAGKVDAIIDLKEFHERIKKISFDYVLDLDVSAPLRSLNDLILAFDKIKKSDAYNLFSVNTAHKNPYFNMVEKNEIGFYSSCKSINTSVLSRQSAPKVFELNASFYFYKKSFFEKKFRMVYTDKSTVFEINHICFDLDEIIDFEFMEFLLKNDKLDFDL